MKKSFTILSLIFALGLFPSVLAAEDVDSLAGLGAMLIVFLVIGLIAFAFWIWMLIDAIKRPNLDNRALWIILMVLLSVIPSVIYYFVVKRKG